MTVTEGGTEKTTTEKLQNRSNSDLLGRPGKHVASSLPPDAGDEATDTKETHQLGDIRN
jgi:hypothetical protein